MSNSFEYVYYGAWSGEQRSIALTWDRWRREWIVKDECLVHEKGFKKKKLAVEYIMSIQPDAKLKEQK